MFGISVEHLSVSLCLVTQPTPYWNGSWKGIPTLLLSPLRKSPLTSTSVLLGQQSRLNLGGWSQDGGFFLSGVTFTSPSHRSLRSLAVLCTISVREKMRFSTQPGWKRQLPWREPGPSLQHGHTFHHAVQMKLLGESSHSIWPAISHFLCKNYEKWLAYSFCFDLILLTLLLVWTQLCVI